MRPLSLLLLAAVLFAHTSTHHGVFAETPKPSDTDNKPATPASGTTQPGELPPPPTPATPPPTPTTPVVTTTPAPTNSTTPAPTKATPEPTTKAPATKVVPIEAPEGAPASNDATTTDAQSDSSSDMGAGAIVGIVLACVGLIAIIAFFVYRHIRARREDAKHYGMEYDASSPPMTVLESSRNNESKMYAMMDAPSTRHARRPTTTNNNATPTDDFVIMTKYATPSSPKFSQNPPQLSPPPFQEEIADFTKWVHNFDKSQPSTEFQSSYRESDTESYAGGASYSGGGSFMNSFDHGVSGFRDTLNSEVNGGTNGAEPSDNNTAHWMEAMDEMRDTNDSYAMLEANSSYNSRGSAMRFSTESDIRG